MKPAAPIPFAGTELTKTRHVCAFFNDDEEEYRVLLPFIKDGFQCGHKAAMPQAIGAQAAYPARQVISLSGDGGFSMLMGDVITLKQEKLPVKVIIFKNESLAFVELEQKASGFPEFATDLQGPDFAKIAEGSGVLGLTARTPDQVEPMIAQALKHDGPAVVEVFVARQELAMPPTVTIEQAKGFSLFMVKAVLNGRGDEIIDLAKVNLFR
jgi:pyruvate dehydrogenase (quinone)